MMKFFRKYTKHLLVGLVVLILVSWLLGSSLQSLLTPDPGAVVIGKAFGEEVPQGLVMVAGSKGKTLEFMGIPWQRPWIQSAQQLQYDRAQPLDAHHWMLLVGEARRSGLLVTDEQLENFKSATGITSQRIRQLQERQYVAVDDINEMIRDFLLVREYARQNIGAAKVSTPEVRHLVRNAMEQVRVQGLVIRAESLVDESQPVSDLEIQSQFAKYKDVLPGEDDLGFGYKWPARVKIEYLELKVDDVVPLVHVTDREARDYWTQNKESFRRPPEDLSTEDAPPEALSVPPSPFYEKFSEAKEDVVAQLKRERAKEEAQRVMSGFLSLGLVEDWDFGKRGDDRFPVAPEVVKETGYLQKVLDRYAGGITKDARFIKLIQVHETDVLPPDELEALPGIGRSWFTLSDGRYTFLNLAQSVQGLAEMPESGESALRSLFLSQYQSTDRVLSDISGNCYGFRVTRVVQPVSPASVDEIRDRVIADVRLARAYEQAELLARRFADSARNTSMTEALDQDAEIKEKLGEDARLQDSGLTAREWAPGIPRHLLGFQDEALVAAVFALGQGFELDKPRPIGAVAAPSGRSWLVVEIQELKPVSEADYARMKDQYRGRLLSQRRAASMAEWFDPKMIEKRTHWEELARAS